MSFCTRHLVRLGRGAQKVATPSILLKQRPSPSPCSALTAVGITGKRCIATAINEGGATSQKVKVDDSLQTNLDAVTIAKTNLDHDSEMVKVIWGGDGSTDIYPYIWLRDNCQCPECYHTSSKNRILLIKDLQLSVSPKEVKLNDSGTTMEILWSDGHRAYYPSGWLQARSFDETRRKERLGVIELKRSFWGAEIAQNLPRGSFPDVMEKDEALLKVLQQLEEFGLVILQDAPLRVGQNEALAKRVGFVRRTPYGDIFAVKSKANASNLAYTANTLDFHVDLAHLDFKPGVQILHCIAQTPGEGGETLFADGFNVAQKLRELHPRKFEVLATTPVAYKDEGVKEQGLELYTINQIPMICLDRSGSITEVVTSNLMRDSFFNVPAEKVKEWYDAMITFDDLVSRPENMISYKMNEGDIVIFDNTRILHGRMSYEVTEGERELEGCYWDWDLARSCRRVLQFKLAGH